MDDTDFDGDSITGFDDRQSSIAKTEPFTESTPGTLDDRRHDTPVRNIRRNNAGFDALRMAQYRDEGSDPSDGSVLEVLSRDVKRMMDTITRLRVLGFETSVVALPKIVVIGDQSTGKSSVIEAISDIKVPRAAGTCTRCPLEINITHSEQPWGCKVYLSRRFTYVPMEQHVSKQNRFGPWEQLESPEDYHFATLNSRDQVAESLVWAQRATLNPGTNWQLFRPGHNESWDQPQEVEFSPNVVRLDISGPGLPNLSFFDLPGLISHVNEGEQYLVRLVDNLAREYMKSEETLILLTLTMNHDVQNSKAAGLIQKAHADNRTLGVFTKPDLLSPDSSELFADVLAGRSFKRELGYFVVKNNHLPHVEHAVARREEKDFFQDWVKQYPAFSRHKQRFGTDLLTHELSKQLVKRIMTSLPKIRNIVEKKVSDLEEKLKELPKPPSGNFSLEIANNLSRLSQDLKSLFNPDAEDFDFYQRWSKANKVFCESLTRSHPRLQLDSEPTNNSLQATSRSPGVMASTEIIMLDDDEPAEAFSTRLVPSDASRSKRRGDQTPTNGSKRRRTDDDRSGAKPRVFTLSEVRNLIARKNDTGLRGLDNPKVTKDIFALSIGHWEAITQGFLRRMSTGSGQAIMAKVRDAFEKQRHTRLFDEVQKKTKSFLLNVFSEHSKFTYRCLRMEKIMFTMNEAASGQIRKDSLKEMRDERALAKARQEVDVDETLSETQKQRKLLAAQKTKEAAADEYDGELQQMATVRGYYDYAATRFAEITALNFRSEAFAEIRDKLCEHLTTELRLDQEDANRYLGTLLEMDSAVANERARCESELVRLNKGLEQLDALEGSSYDTSLDGTFESESTIL